MSENDTVLDENRNPIGTKFTKRVLREVFLLEGGVVALILGICIVGYSLGTVMLHCIKRLMTRSGIHSSSKRVKSIVKDYPNTPSPSLEDLREGLIIDEPTKKRTLETDV